MKQAYQSIKGQVLSFDFLISCGIFMLVVAIIVAQVGQNSKKISESEKINNMVGDAYRLSEIYFSEGYPENWNSNNVKIIGLETNDRLDWNKVKSLEELGYEKSIAFLGLSNDYQIAFFKGDEMIYSFGKSYENATSVIKVDRIGILNNTIISIQTLVFS